MSFMLGDKLYIYDEYLGTGGNANVYLYHGQDGTQYAVKVSYDYDVEMIADMLTADPNYQGPFTSAESVEGEARVLNYIHNKLHGHYHPNLVYYVDSGNLPSFAVPVSTPTIHTQPVVVIIESYIEGPTLRQIVEDNINIDLFKLTTDLLSAVYTLQSIGVDYFDLTGDNVIYDKHSGNYVLIDFGETLVHDVAFLDHNQRHSRLMDSVGQESPLGFLLGTLVEETYTSTSTDPRLMEFATQLVNTKDSATLVKILSLIFNDRDVVINTADRMLTYRDGVLISEIDADLLVPNITYELDIKQIRDDFKELGTTLSTKINYKNYSRLATALHAYKYGPSAKDKLVAKEIFVRYGILNPTKVQRLKQLEEASVDSLLAMISSPLPH